MTEDKRLFLALEDYKPNGIVHVGSKDGSFARYYHGIGVYQVWWLSAFEDAKLHGKMYQHAGKYGMHQKFTFGDYTNIYLEWRANAVDIDMEAYDVLHIECTEKIEDILNGLGMFKNNFKIIVLSNAYGSYYEQQLSAMGYRLQSFIGQESMFVRNDV